MTHAQDLNVTHVSPDGEGFNTLPVFFNRCYAKRGRYLAFQ
jgi:hypothetical protein